VSIYGTISLLAEVNVLDEIVSKRWTIHAGTYEIPFTNHMLMIAVSSLLLMVAFPLAMRKPGLIRKGFGNMIEAVCVILREDMARPFLKEQTDRYIGILWTLFFFILTMNILGMMPIAQAVFVCTGYKHIGGAATANVYVTGALAVFSFVLFHAAGIKQKGIWHYIKTFCPKVPIAMLPFMFVLEVVSSFVRMFTLAIRLFANILAGHILLGVVLSFIVIYKTYMVATASILGTLMFSLLEVFVAFLQAYIFVFLTTIFIGFAISDEH
jgi:F-type H+-transporting ATPase subunit a